MAAPKNQKQESSLPQTLQTLLRGLKPEQWREVGLIFWEEQSCWRKAALAQASTEALGTAEEAFAGFYTSLLQNNPAKAAIVREIIGGK